MDDEIVFYCSLLFYRSLLWYYRLDFILTQLASCHFTPVIYIFHFKTWPLRFAQSLINQWKLAISRGMRYKDLQIILDALHDSTIHPYSLSLSGACAFPFPFMGIIYSGTAYIDTLLLANCPEPLSNSLKGTYILLSMYFVFVCVVVFSQFIYSNLLLLLF